MVSCPYHFPVSQLQYKQDRQCTCNVTMRHIHAKTVAVEKAMCVTQLSVCICGLRYPACNAHAPYCHLWPCPALQYFSTLSHKQHDVREKS